MKTALLAGIAALSAPALFAQDNPFAPQPSEELDAFAPALGNWAGAGTVVTEPGGDAMEWTAKSTSKRILGGHYVQEDMRVDFGIGSMSFRTIYGIDTATGELVARSVGSTGGSMADIRWIADDVLVNTSKNIEDGKPVVERWTTTYSENGYRTVGERAIGDGPWFEHVVGEMRRSESAFDVASVKDEGPFMAEVPAEMKKLGRIIGEYEIAGEMTMMPGLPAMEITATESSEYYFGGMATYSHTLGQPGDYEAHGYGYWDARKSRYVQFGVSSMGEFGASEGSWDGDSLVYFSTAPMMGAGGATRLIVNFDGDRLADVEMTRLPSTGDAFVMFTAKYEPVETKTAIQFREGSCCDKAAKAGGACTHPCCVAAVADGKACARCNG